MSYKIQKISIKRFRSLHNLELNINLDTNIIGICGENNTGKTNILRAINLFFNPQEYNRNEDVPSHKLASGGGATYPEITINFKDKKSLESYVIKRRFDSHDLLSTTGKRNNSVELQENEINSFLNKIKLFFIRSINVSFPDLINQIIEEVYEKKYSKVRLSGSKKEIKQSYNKYQDLLSDALEGLSSEITELFSIYNNTWKIEFKFESNIAKFIDLISDDIKVYINDGSNSSLDAKGSGLQRLAYILLNYKIIKEISQDFSIIVLLDEPDAYLHSALQKKLQAHLKEISQESQIFLTTHSSIFLDTYSLSNIFLLDLKKTAVHYKRKPDKTFYKIDTQLVPLTHISGIKQIRQYLGISPLETKLSPYNFLVEGEADRIYIEGLCRYFNLEVPQIEVASGANNFNKMLEFYDALYKGIDSKPQLLVICDNDSKGREVLPKIDTTKFKNIIVKKEYIPNFCGEIPSKTANLEIEDFIYPKIIAYCANVFLEQRGLQKINPDELESKIQTNSRKNKGILDLLDSLSNDVNPDKSDKISFQNEGVKSGLAGIFKRLQEVNPDMLLIIKEGKTDFPQVETFLKRITIFN